MAKANNRKNPFKNKRNIRRRNALVRAEKLHTIYNAGKARSGMQSSDLEYTKQQAHRVAKEIAVLKTRIVMV